MTESPSPIVVGSIPSSRTNFETGSFARWVSIVPSWLRSRKSRRLTDVIPRALRNPRATSGPSGSSHLSPANEVTRPPKQGGKAKQAHREVEGGRTSERRNVPLCKAYRDKPKSD